MGSSTFFRDRKLHKNFYMIPLFLMPYLISCVYTKALLRDKNVKFPKSRHVEILIEKPEEPYIVIAILETKGGIGTSLPEILENMRKKAEEIGADAIIPVQDVSEYRSSSIFYNPWLGGYQTLPGGKLPAIRGYAIIYKSTVIRLKQRGYNFYKPQRIFNGGIAVNLAPLVMKGGGFNGWLGKDKVRFISEVFTFSIPDAFYGEPLENGRLDFGFRLGFDIFPFGEIKGFYLPYGIENWNYSIGLSNSSVKTKYNMFYLSLGIGYLVNLSEKIYFDSKFSFNISMASDQLVTVGSYSFVPDKQAYNFFLGIGVRF